MGQIEEFKINPLPSITWNWLRLNDVNVKWNMDIEPCNIEIKEDNNEKAKDADIWGDIKTGAGEAADVIFAGETVKLMWQHLALEIQTIQKLQTVIQVYVRKWFMLT